MRTNAAGAKLTYDDFLLFPDDGQRHELIDGEHYVTPSPNLTHQRVLGNLYWLLRSYLETNAVGEVFMAPLDVILSHYDVVEPDLLYVARERGQDILKQYVHGAPDLAIEIGSPFTRQRDETIKRRLYERAGVEEYWIVDPDQETVRVLRRRGDRFGQVRELTRESGDVLTSPLFPNLELKLADVFRW